MSNIFNFRLLIVVFLTFLLKFYILDRNRIKILKILESVLHLYSNIIVLNTKVYVSITFVLNFALHATMRKSRQHKVSCRRRQFKYKCKQTFNSFRPIYPNNISYLHAQKGSCDRCNYPWHTQTILFPYSTPTITTFLWVNLAFYILYNVVDCLPNFQYF